MKLTQREGLSKPTYETIQSGSPHMPTFFSTVKVGGMEFHGKGGRSKKQAEQDAAKIAYIALKECGVNLCAAFFPFHIENKAVKPNHSSDDTKCKQNLKHEDELSDLRLCNRFKVYTSFPNIPFPEGIAVLPVCDNKWVAVSLEFPNGKEL